MGPSLKYPIWHMVHVVGLVGVTPYPAATERSSRQVCLSKGHVLLAKYGAGTGQKRLAINSVLLQAVCAFSCACLPASTWLADCALAGQMLVDVLFSALSTALLRPWQHWHCVHD